jgi:hypothetical protein
MTSEQWSTTRRSLMLLIAVLVAPLSKKLGVDLTDTAGLGLDALFAVYLLASNAKEVLKHAATTKAALPQAPFVAESGAAVKPDAPSTVLGP